MQQALKVIEKEANNIVIAPIQTKKDMVAATELLSQANKYLKAVIEEKEKVTKPLNEALKAERARFKPLETKLEGMIAAIRANMSTYQTAEVARAREEAAKIAARIGEGKGKLKVETAVNKIENIETADESVSTDSGMVKFREDKVLKITDEEKIPRKFLLVDEKAVLAALKNGEKVPGAEIEIKLVPVNYR